jgi:hypothetical protein
MTLVIFRCDEVRWCVLTQFFLKLLQKQGGGLGLKSNTFNRPVSAFS